MTFEPGHSVAHYRLLELIGEGGMGRVYRALDTRLNRQVAIKILLPALTSDEKIRRRFLREARAAAAVSHPAIAAVHEVNEAEGSAYIVMEFVEGRTLRKLIQGRALPMTEALRIAVEIAEGLVEAHRAGVIHRDLKPDNIIVRPDHRPKILDFGIAKLLEDRSGLFRRRTQASTTSLTGEGRIMGTLGYMSPEQARGEPVDARSDIFSFGVILYEMVTGQAPFKGRTPIDTLTSILKESPPPASGHARDVHPKVEEVLEECLEKDPARRFQRMEDLLAGLRIAQLALQEAAMRRTTFEHPAMKAPAESPTATPRASARRRWVVPAAAAALVVLLAAGGTYLWLRGGAGPPSEGGAAAAPGPGRAAGAAELARSLTTDAVAYREYTAAEQSLHEDRWEDAISELERAIGADPNFPLAYYRLAFARAWGGRPGESVAALEQGLPAADRLPEPWQILYKAQLQWRSGEAAKARTALDDLVTKYPDLADGWYLLGEIHTHTSRFVDPDRARECFRKALDLDPEFRVVLHHLVYDDLAAGDLADARKLIGRRDGAGGPDAPEDEATVAIRFAEGDLDGALRLGQAALARGHANVRLLLAEILIARGDFPHALEVAEAAAAGGGERPAARIVRARALAATGRLKEALAAYAEAASSFGGTNLERYGAFCETARAQILAAAGDLQGAAAAALKGTGIDPWYAPARFWLGRLLVEAGQTHDARTVLEETEKKMESEGPPPAAFWLHVLRAEVRRGEGDLGAALSEIGKASSMPPELTSPEILRFTEARVKEAFGDLPGAIASYRQGLEPLARELWRDRVVTPLALYDLARLEERAGRPDAARGHYRAFLAEWDRADMPVAAVEDARTRLKLLEH